MLPKLGIIAGGGQMPAQLAEICREQNRPYFVLGIEGAADMAALAESPHASVALGAIGQALQHLKAEGVQQIVMAGGIKRPSMSRLHLDATGAKLMAKLGLKLLGGDDAVLREVIRFLESEGFTVVGAETIRGGLLAPAGVMGAIKPDAGAKEDIALGFRVARALGSLDVGQAAIVENGCVLGVEGAEGTDALIVRCALLCREKKRAVLVKVKKPHQEARTDLPSVGVQTIERLHESGMAGVAVEAEGALLLQRDEMLQAADRLGVFVIGMKG